MTHVKPLAGTIITIILCQIFAVA